MIQLFPARAPCLIRARMVDIKNHLAPLQESRLPVYGEPWMKTISGLFSDKLVFSGQLVNKSIDAVLFIPTSVDFEFKCPFVINTPGAPDLEIENIETRPTVGNDDTEDKGEIVKPFYENLVEYPTADAKSTRHHVEPAVPGAEYLSLDVKICAEPKHPPPTEVSLVSGMTPEQLVEIVSDNVLNIEVHIPNFVRLSDDFVTCSGVTKTGKFCQNRRRLAEGQTIVYCHHHLNQMPAAPSGICDK